jgi:hypothetical protein
MIGAQQLRSSFLRRDFSRVNVLKVFHSNFQDTFGNALELFGRYLEGIHNSRFYITRPL